MFRLLSIEFQKIFKNRASKVLVILYFSLLFLLFLISNIEFDLGPIHVNIADQGIFNFPFIWHFNTYVADYFKIFFSRCNRFNDGKRIHLRNLKTKLN